MEFKGAKVPDLLSNLPSGERAQTHQPKKVFSSRVRSTYTAPNSTQSLGPVGSKSLSAGGSQLLGQKTKRSTPGTSFIQGDSGAGSRRVQDEDCKEEQELAFKELLEISMEETAQKVFDLDLRQKQLKSIPFALKEFKRLKILDISSNAISDISNLMENKELKELKLYDNKITSISLLDSQKDLSSLQLQYNSIAKIGSGLSPLKKLNSLRLNNNKLGSVEVRELAPVSQLVYLDISFNRLKDISAVVCLPNLEELWADNNQLESLPDFSRCKKLRDLHVSHNCLTSLTILRSIPQLEELDASQNRIAEMPVMACSLQRLTCLNLADNHLLDFDWLPTVCPDLYTLDMSDNGPSELSEDLAVVLSRLENLFELSFTSCQTPVAAIQRLLPGLDFYNGFGLNRPSSASGQLRGGPPPPMRPMSAASVVTARQVENQMRSLQSRLESLEAQTEQAFLHARSRLSRQLAPPEATDADAADAEEPPLTGRSSRHSRLRDALQFGRQSQAM